MVKVSKWDGGKVGKRDLDDSSLGELVKKRLLRGAVLQYEANRRQGTVKTKTRAETAYTGNKPFKQKGTGNARRGDRNSPLLRGGGVIFGPRPRDYTQHMPRKAKREALRSALRGKLGDSEVAALDGKAFTEPKTKTAQDALLGLGAQRSATIVVPSDNVGVWKSFRNIPRVDVVRASDLNAYHVLARDWLVLVDDAWTVLMDRLDDGKPAPAESGSGEGGES